MFVLPLSRLFSLILLAMYGAPFGVTYRKGLAVWPSAMNISNSRGHGEQLMLSLLGLENVEVEFSAFD
jgi:hypothetical protein